MHTEPLPPCSTPVQISRVSRFRVDVIHLSNLFCVIETGSLEKGVQSVLILASMETGPPFTAKKDLDFVGFWKEAKRSFYVQVLNRTKDA
jgi:hypothetical protein